MLEPTLLAEVAVSAAPDGYEKIIFALLGGEAGIFGLIIAYLINRLARVEKAQEFSESKIQPGLDKIDAIADAVKGATASARYATSGLTPEKISILSSMADEKAGEIMAKRTS